MEQNQTLNAANAHVDGAVLLEVEPGLDTSKCSAIRRGVGAGAVLADAIIDNVRNCFCKSGGGLSSRPRRLIDATSSPGATASASSGR